MTQDLSLAVGLRLLIRQLVLHMYIMQLISVEINFCCGNCVMDFINSRQLLYSL